MSGLHHQLIDFIQNIGVEKIQVVLECLPIIACLVFPVSMLEHLPYRVVMVDQLMEAVMVGV